MIKSRKQAILYLALASVLWSTGGLLIKLVDWHPVAIAGARSGIAAIVMLCYLKQPIKQFNGVKILGALAYAATLIMFVIATKLTTAANAILLQYTAPIWVALLAGWFLNEKPRRSDWLAIITVMLGMTLFFMGDLSRGKLIGNVLGLCCGITLACVVILLKKQKNCSPVEMTLLGNALTFLVSLPFFFTSVPSGRSIFGLLLLGVFQLGISYILYAVAIQHVNAIEGILVPVIEPLLNPIWVFLFVGEVPGGYAIVGGTIAVVAIVLRGIYQQQALQAKQPNF